MSLPLHKGKHRRLVPNMVVTNGPSIALLRYKTGRQPAWLRRITRQKLNSLRELFWNIQALEQSQPLAATEDTWDVIVARQAKQERLEISSTTSGSEKSWAAEGGEFVRVGWDAYKEHTQYWAVKGWELFQIRKQEQWLAEKEALPYKIASAVQNGQRLQEKVLAFQREKYESTIDPNAATGPATGTAWLDAARDVFDASDSAFVFRPRSKEQSKQLIRESIDVAPLIIPVEWSRKVVDKQRPRWLNWLPKDYGRERAEGIKRK